MKHGPDYFMRLEDAVQASNGKYILRQNGGYKLASKRPTVDAWAKWNGHYLLTYQPEKDPPIGLRHYPIPDHPTQ